jgi:CRP-like cAMP-binding protein
MVLLERGVAEVVVSEPEGARAFVAFRGAGSMIGEYALLDDVPRCATVITTCRVQGRAYPKRPVREFLGRHPDAMAALTAGVLRKTRAAVDRRIRYGTGEPGERIARVLLDHADEFGRETDGVRAIDVPLSHGRIADLIQGSSSSVAQHLRRWGRTGVLTTGYRGTRRLCVLDRGALLERAAA